MNGEPNPRPATNAATTKGLYTKEIESRGKIFPDQLAIWYTGNVDCGTDDGTAVSANLARDHRKLLTPYPKRRCGEQSFVLVPA